MENMAPANPTAALLCGPISSALRTLSGARFWYSHGSRPSGFLDTDGLCAAREGSAIRCGGLISRRSAKALVLYGMGNGADKGGSAAPAASNPRPRRLCKRRHVRSHQFHGFDVSPYAGRWAIRRYGGVALLRLRGGRRFWSCSGGSICSRSCMLPDMPIAGEACLIRRITMPTRQSWVCRSRLADRSPGWCSIALCSIS